MLKNNKEYIRSVESSLTNWLTSNGSKGIDPYSILQSPIMHWIDQRWHLGGRLAIQSQVYSPINLQYLLGVSKDYNSKGLGLLARGYFFKWDQTHNPVDKSRGISYLKILNKLRIQGYTGDCWGHPFPYRTRRGYLPANKPNIVSTFYAGQAYLDAFERFEENDYLKTAKSIGQFIVNDLERIGEANSFCFSYVPGYKMAVHNTNLLAVQFLCRLAKTSNEPSLLELAKPALDYTIFDQQADGSWLYDAPQSVSRDNTFIDGFHTGFILESLWEISQNTGWNLEKPIRMGVNYYIKNLFSDYGQPLHRANRNWSVDLRDCAQAIIVMSKLARYLPDRNFLHLVLAWTIKYMQSPEGYFYFWRNKLWANPIPYIRFQGWILVALETAASQI